MKKKKPESTSIANVKIVSNQALETLMIAPNCYKVHFYASSWEKQNQMLFLYQTNIVPKEYYES